MPKTCIAKRDKISTHHTPRIREGTPTYLIRKTTSPVVTFISTSMRCIVHDSVYTGGASSGTAVDGPAVTKRCPESTAWIPGGGCERSLAASAAFRDAGVDNGAVVPTTASPPPTTESVRPLELDGAVLLESELDGAYRDGAWDAGSGGTGGASESTEYIEGCVDGAAEETEYTDGAEKSVSERVGAFCRC